MAEFLLRQGEEIEVYGMMRRSANPNFINAQNFKDHPRFKFVFGDLSDDVSIDKLVNDIKPDYFINFAANSFVGCSWDMPEQVFETNTIGVLRCLSQLKNSNLIVVFTLLEAVKNLVTLIILHRTSTTQSNQEVHMELQKLPLGI